MGIGGKIKLEEGTAGGTYVGFKAPDTEVVSDLIWVLPSADGTAGQLMATDGSMNIVWSDEPASRLAADSTLQANVNSEVTARMNADSTLQSLVNAVKGTSVAQTADQVDALLPITHGVGDVPEISFKVSNGTDYEGQDWSSIFVVSSTQIKLAGDSLVTLFGTGTNVILRYWKIG